ncbi:MAG: TetR/AcrR family transcriptional regulator [Rhodovibrionaceae bacterium]
MPRDGSATRSKIMDAAEALILKQGFSASAIDSVIAEAGITKGSFFYHFPNKAALARALVDRYAKLDLAHLEENMARAENLSRDPLQQLLIFIGLFIEAAESLTEPYPGCLFASFISEAGLFDEETLGVITDTYTAWRERLVEKLGRIAESHPPRQSVDLESLAEMLTVVFEGAFIVSKTQCEPEVVAEQLIHYRSYLELLFSAPER